MIDNFFNRISKIFPTKWCWIFQHAGFKRYFANTSWMFLGQMFSLSVSFLVGTWLARYLGPTRFGIFSYVISFTGLFSFLADFGINSILNRELVIESSDKKNNLLETAFYLRVFSGLLAFLVVNFVTLFLSISPTIRILILLYSLIFIFQAFSVFSVFFQSRVESKNNVKAQFFSSIIASIIKIIIILNGGSLFWLVSVYVLEVILLGALLFSKYYFSGFKIKVWNFNFKLAKKLLFNSYPLALVNVFSFIYLRLDQIMLKSIIGDSAVGIYAAAARISEIWYIIPMTICPSLFVAIVNSRKNDKLLYFNRLKKLFLLMFYLALIIIIFVNLLAKPIIVLLYGGYYIQAIPILRIYSYSMFGTFLGVAAGQYLLVENYTKIYFFITFFGAAVNIVLNIFLIPKIGLTGAAIATVFSYIFVIISLFFFKKTRQDLFKIIFNKNVL